MNKHMVNKITFIIICGIYKITLGSVEESLRDRIYYYEDQLNDLIMKQDRTKKECQEIIEIVNHIDEKYGAYLKKAKLDCFLMMKKFAEREITKE